MIPYESILNWVNRHNHTYSYECSSPPKKINKSVLPDKAIAKWSRYVDSDWFFSNYSVFCYSIFYIFIGNFIVTCKTNYQNILAKNLVSIYLEATKLGRWIYDISKTNKYQKRKLLFNKFTYWPIYWILPSLTRESKVARLNGGGAMMAKY